MIISSHFSNDKNLSDLKSEINRILAEIDIRETDSLKKDNEIKSLNIEIESLLKKISFFDKNSNRMEPGNQDFESDYRELLEKNRNLESKYAKLEVQYHMDISVWKNRSPSFNREPIHIKEDINNYNGNEEYLRIQLLDLENNNKKLRLEIGRLNNKIEYNQNSADINADNRNVPNEEWERQYHHLMEESQVIIEQLSNDVEFLNEQKDKLEVLNEDKEKRLLKNIELNSNLMTRVSLAYAELERLFRKQK